MACFKEAEHFLAKLPSLSLEGMEPLGSQGVREQAVAMETQGYKVGLAGRLPPPEGLPACLSLGIYSIVSQSDLMQTLEVRLSHHADFI